MWHFTLSLCLIIVGIIHLLPGVGVLGQHHLAMLYGVQFTSPEALLLMRHRAVLFVIVGCLLLASVRLQQLQWAAIVAGAVSVLSFLLLAAFPSIYTPQIGKVFYIDVLALLLLLVAAVIKWLSRPA